MNTTRPHGSRRAVVIPDFPHAPAPFEALTAWLWRERDLLDHLLFGLTSQRVLLESGTLRWLSVSSAQITDVVEALREHEVVRAVVAEELTVDLGLTSPATLSVLAAEAPEPYCSILRELGDALRALTDELDEAVRRNDDLLLALVGRESPGRSVGAEQ